MKSLISALTASLVSDEKTLTRELRKNALAAGWPKEIARILEVHITDNGINVSYPESMIEAVEDLEYGTELRPPTSVFRMFDERNKDELLTTLSESSINYLVDMDVIP